eukprot:TRINITY_DN25176_c0_g1_i1.p1 TRINITY_DN25176_c0_g1~~TRINITY_DN25176_c0_g1_i1.p1  ORF type:complete len:1002 (+),score=114.19 TRINITY_DN25176_c0_g1_i1:88-3006(+)
MTQNISEAALLQALVNVSVGLDAVKRAEGEQLLMRWLKTPGFGSELVKVMLMEGVPVGARQLAAVVLKKLVKECWDDIVGSEEKQLIRACLPRAFFLQDTKLTTMAGVVVGEIATHDFPEEWPTLLTDLVNVLASSQPPPVVAATVKCLRLIAEDIPVDIAGTYSDTALPGLCQVINTPTVATNVRRNALLAVDHLIQTSTEVSLKVSDIPKGLKAVIAPLARLCVGYVTDHSNPLLASASFSFFNLVVSCYPTVIESVLPGLITATCDSLAKLLLTSDVPDGYTSDGDTINHTNLTLNHLELISNFLKKKKPRAVMEKTLGLRDPSKLRVLLELLLKAMRLSDEEVEHYVENPSSYVQDEEQFDEGYSWSVREVCCTVLEELHGVYKEASLKAMLAIANPILSSPQTHSWKDVEATILALQTTYLKPKLLEASGLTPSTILTVVNSILPTARYPLLISRLFWLVTKTIYQLPVSSVPPEILKHAVACIKNTSVSHIIRTQACKAYICVHKKTEGGGQTAGEVVSALRMVLTEARTVGSPDTQLKGDVLNSYIEDLAIIIKINPTADVAALPQDAITLWHRYHSDPFTVEAVTDLFSVMAASPSGEQSIRQVIPYLVNLLSNPDSLPPGMVSSGIIIMSHIMKRVSMDLLTDAAMLTLPLMEHLTVKQHATSPIAMCLRVLSDRIGGAGLSKLTIQSPSKGKVSGLVIAMAILQHTLHPDNSEHSLAQTGKLVLQLIGVASDQLGVEGMSGLLTLVIQRFTTATTSLIAQELLLPIAAMATRNSSGLYSFLTDPRNPLLQSVLQTWNKWIPDFWGSKQELTLILTGLAVLAGHVQDTVTIRHVQSKKKGKDIVVDVPGRLGVFISVGKLLISTLDQVTESKDLLYGDDYSDEEDEEFEEDEDDEEDREGTDANSSSEEEAYTISKEIVASICGPDPIGTAKAYLKSHMGELGPASLPYFTEKERQALEKELM